jgi:hypothetical protein
MWDAKSIPYELTNWLKTAVEQTDACAFYSLSAME